MQEVHPAGSATPTPAVIGFTDRRQTHNHHQRTTAAALKCPRCDSLNTKFCYYNNYNLSQPRHFCKNCRRYWTNGGVLRNVPVGGGSRKSSKPKPKHKPKLKPKPNISSTTNTTEGNGKGVVLSHAAQKQDEVLTCANPNPNPNPETLGFGGPLVQATASFGEIMQTEEIKVVQGILAEAVADQTVRIEDFVQSSGGDGGVVALDWQGSDSSNGFGLGLIDDQSYWSQSTTTSFDDRHLQNQQQWFDDHHHSNATSDNNYLPLFLP